MTRADYDAIVRYVKMNRTCRWDVHYHGGDSPRSPQCVRCGATEQADLYCNNRTDAHVAACRTCLPTLALEVLIGMEGTDARV